MYINIERRMCLYFPDKEASDTYPMYQAALRFSQEGAQMPEVCPAKPLKLPKGWRKTAWADLDYADRWGRTQKDLRLHAPDCRVVLRTSLAGHSRDCGEVALPETPPWPESLLLDAEYYNEAVMCGLDWGGGHQQRILEVLP